MTAKPFSAQHTATKTALVTAGASRMGRVLCLALAGMGFDVAVHYGESESAVDAQALVRELQVFGVRACAVQADLGDESAVLGLVHRASEALGEIGVLVNNASVLSFDALTQCAPLTFAGFERHFRVNTFAPVMLMQQFVQQIEAPQKGVVINLLDQPARDSHPEFLSYHLSKTSLESATTIAATLLAPRVRVVGIALELNSSLGDLTALETIADDVAKAMIYAITAQNVTGTTLLVSAGQP